MKLKQVGSVAIKLGIALAALAGILIQAGAFSGRWRWSVFNYFTLVSNVLCVVYYGIAVSCATRGRASWQPVLKGALVMGMTVTGLVYHVMLSGSFTMQGTMAVSDALLHTVVPLLTVLDWLIFEQKGRTTWKYPFAWVILPDAYFVTSVVRVALGASLGYGGNRYPYPFLNADALGWGRVWLNVAVMHVFFILLGYLFVAIDKLMAQRAAQPRA
ncbi:MAG: Pr6Pr family membrane protein [Clostridiales bacterium]|nr:Pr6Pr family membrane protein [Clostridiales bacterium]